MIHALRLLMALVPVVLLGCASQAAAQPAPPLTDVQIIAVRSAASPQWESIAHGDRETEPVHGGAWAEVRVEDFGYGAGWRATLSGRVGEKTGTTNVERNGQVIGFRHVFRFEGVSSGPLEYSARSSTDNTLRTDRLSIRRAPANPPGPGPDPEPTPKTQLRVALYRWIPDAGLDGFDAMLGRIKSEFEALHPDIELVVEMPPDDDLDDYDPASIASALDKRFDVIELDAVMLTDVVATGKVVALDRSLVAPSTHPASIEASTIDGTLYGIPHLLCTNVVISRSEQVAAATSATELRAALEALGTDKVNLIGDWEGSWTTASLYLDALADSKGADQLPRPVPTEADADVVRAMKPIVDQCRRFGINPCLDGTFDGDAAAIVFGWGEADALFGYTERLHVVMRSNALGGPIHIGPAAFGEGSNTVLFTDSFVVSASADASVRAAADKFIKYMLEPEVFEWYLLAGDAPWNPVPRYLLPSRMDLRSRPAFADDPYYPRLFELIDGASPMPGEGLYENRKDLGADVMRKLDAASN